MGSEHEEDLRRQMLANPDELSVRSINADVVHARNDARGELVALELAGDVQAARDLADRHAKIWWPEVSHPTLATKPGFIERIAVGVHDVAKTARVCASEPIRDLELMDLHPTLFLREHQLRPDRLVRHGDGSTWPRVLAETRTVKRLDFSRARPTTYAVRWTRSR